VCGEIRRWVCAQAGREVELDRGGEGMPQCGVVVRIRVMRKGDVD
jgi:hypothetical protein